MIYSFGYIDFAEEAQMALSIGAGLFNKEEDNWTDYRKLCALLREKAAVDKNETDVLCDLYEEIMSVYDTSDAEYQGMFAQITPDIAYVTYAELCADMKLFLRNAKDAEEAHARMRQIIFWKLGLENEQVPDNDMAFIARIGRESFSPQMKWACTDILVNTEQSVTKYDKMIARALRVTEKYKLPLEKIADAWKKRMETSAQSGALDAMIESIGVKLDEEKIELQPSLMAFHVFFLGMEKRLCNAHTVTCGIYIDKIVEADASGQNRQEEALQFLHAADDEKRLQILCLLKQEAMNGKTLAEKTGLSGATVSHHMNALVTAGLVTIDKKGNNFSYRPNTEKIKKKIKILEELL